MKKYVLEILAIVAVVIAVVYVLDRKRVFVFNDPNNHADKRWEYYYRITKTNPADVIVLGNSHAYTGLLPKELSCNLGQTCFVMASGGTAIRDGYYMLEEALTRSTPKVVIIETFSLGNYDRKHLSKGALTDEIKSFDARRNTMLKLRSTPRLFNVDNAPYAWSTTLRNHSFLFDKEKMKAPKQRPVYQDALYLGRYVRFTSGMTPETLARYEKEGPAVDGTRQAVGEGIRKDLERVLSLCDRKGIQVVFLTLPMWPESISHWEDWQRTLSGLIGNRPWIDLQGNPDFGPDAFEDVYGAQHLTYEGALLATDRLASCLREACPSLRTPRYNETAWLRTFYAQDGFYDNLPPPEGDPNARVFVRDEEVGGLHVKEFFVARQPRGNYVVCKIMRDSFPEGVPPSLTVAGRFTKDGEQIVSTLPLPFNRYFLTKDYFIYSTYIDPAISFDELLQ